MSAGAEWIRRQTLARQAREAHERARQLRLTIQFAEGMGGRADRRLVAEFDAACESAIRAQEWMWQD